MNYLVIGRDYADGFERRQQQREAHLQGVKLMKAKGQILYAVAIMEEGKMKGSVMVMNFATQEELNHWRSTEPYIVGDVWENIEITECAIPPIFS